MRILIAEDDSTSRNMPASALNKAGHEPMETVNSAVCCELLRLLEIISYGTKTCIPGIGKKSS